MGHGIKIRPLYIDNNELSVGGVEDEDYISYNWGYLSDYFSVCEHLIGRCGKDIAINLQNAIYKLKFEGIDIFDVSKLEDGWFDRADDSKKKGVFMYVLDSLIKVTNKYPDSYFFSDVEETSFVYKNGLIVGSVNGYHVEGDF